MMSLSGGRVYYSQPYAALELN
jgi:hypothetical protein